MGLGLRTAGSCTDLSSDAQHYMEDYRVHIYARDTLGRTFLAMDLTAEVK